MKITTNFHKFSAWAPSGVRNFIDIKALRRNRKKLRIPGNKFKYVPEKKVEASINVEALVESPKGLVPIPNPFEREKKKCILCSSNIVPDYKNVKLLSQFQSPFTGRIYGRHITGLCKRQQKILEEEIAKAQRSGMMAYYLKEVDYLKDPKLFDPNKPIRPHPH